MTGTRTRTAALIAICLIVPSCRPGGAATPAASSTASASATPTASAGPSGFATCETLDTLPVGQTAVVGAPPSNSFQPPLMDIGARPFTLANGTTASGGFSKTETGGKAGGSGVELEVNNILLAFQTNLNLTGLRFAFGEYGGNLNVSINNKFLNFDNFASLNGTTVAGVAINVPSGGNGNDQGVIEFVGSFGAQSPTLGQLAVGGQELFIDNICFGT